MRGSVQEPEVETRVDPISPAVAEKLAQEKQQVTAVRVFFLLLTFGILVVATAGILGKLYSEAVEAIDPGPVEGIRATGASRMQEILFGILPQVMPLWISFTLYRFESNVRSASVLGIVGAGGIGVSLYQSFGAFQYGKICTILIILVTARGMLDFLSSRIRSQLV